MSAYDDWRDVETAFATMLESIARELRAGNVVLISYVYDHQNASNSTQGLNVQLRLASACRPDSHRTSLDAIGADFTQAFIHSTAHRPRTEPPREEPEA